MESQAPWWFIGDEPLGLHPKPAGRPASKPFRALIVRRPSKENRIPSNMGPSKKKPMPRRFFQALGFLVELVFR